MTSRAPFYALPDRLLSTCCRVLMRFALTGVIVASLPSTTMANNNASGHHERLIRGDPPNVQVSHDRYPDHAEPYLAVNPRRPNNLVGAAQLLIRSAIPVAGTFTSFDSGKTWHDNGPLPSVAANTASLDVTVTFNAAGSAYVAALINSISGSRNGTDTRIVVWHSADGGRTFHHPVTIAQGQELDHPWLAADPSGTSLYLVWSDKIRNRLDFSRSLNSGRTFSPARLLYQARGIRPLVGDPVLSAGRNGLVGVAFYDRSGGAPSAIRVMTSFNRGRSFRAPRTLPQPAGMTAFYGGRQQPSTGVSIAIDPRSTTLDVAYAAYRPFTTHADILLSRSADGGKTWTRPVRVNRDPGTDSTINHQPQVAVDPRGHVFVSYFALAYGRIDQFLGVSTSWGSNFQRPIRVTARSFDPRLGITAYRNGLWWIGDYQGLAVGPRAVYPMWNDTRTGHLQIFAAAVSIARSTTAAVRAMTRFASTHLAHGRVNVFLSRSTDGGVRFENAVRVSTLSFDPALSQPRTSPWLGDYQGLAAGPRMIYPFWSDTRTGHMEIVTCAVPET